MEEDGTYDVDIILSKYDDYAGGYQNNNLTITYDELVGMNKMVFHVFEYLPVPVTEEQQMNMFTYLSNQEYKEELRPTFE